MVELVGIRALTWLSNKWMVKNIRFISHKKMCKTDICIEVMIIDIFFYILNLDIDGTVIHI